MLLINLCLTWTEITSRCTFCVPVLRTPCCHANMPKFQRQNWIGPNKKPLNRFFFMYFPRFWTPLFKFFFNFSHKKHLQRQVYFLQAEFHARGRSIFFFSLITLLGSGILVGPSQQVEKCPEMERAPTVPTLPRAKGQKKLNRAYRSSVHCQDWFKLIIRGKLCCKKTY